MVDLKIPWSRYRGNKVTKPSHGAVQVLYTENLEGRITHQFTRGEVNDFYGGVKAGGRALTPQLHIFIGRRTSHTSVRMPPHRDGPAGGRGHGAEC